MMRSMKFGPFLPDFIGRQGHSYEVLILSVFIVSSSMSYPNHPTEVSRMQWLLPTISMHLKKSSVYITERRVLLLVVYSSFSVFNKNLEKVFFHSGPVFTSPHILCILLLVFPQTQNKSFIIKMLTEAKVVSKK